MQNTPLLSLLRSTLALAILLAAVAAASASGPEPPKGFTALFNGKDLSGWHGMPHFDPYQLATMPEAKRKKLIDDWTADAKKHWKAECCELINDGSNWYVW